MNRFCEMVQPMKVGSCISRRGHFQEASPQWLSNHPKVIFDPELLKQQLVMLPLDHDAATGTL